MDVERWLEHVNGRGKEWVHVERKREKRRASCAVCEREAREARVLERRGAKHWKERFTKTKMSKERGCNTRQRDWHEAQSTRAQCHGEETSSHS